MPRRIEVSILTDDERVRIVKFMNTNHTNFKDARNACILSLLYYNGLKTHEIRSLDIDNYSVKKELLFLKNRKVKINPTQRKILLNCLSFRDDEYPPFFISIKNYNRIQRNQAGDRKVRLTDRTIQRAVKEVFELLKINKDIKPKDFRHSLGIKLSSLGASHKYIDKTMGKVAPWVKTDYRKLSKNLSNS